MGNKDSKMSKQDVADLRAKTHGWSKAELNSWLAKFAREYPSGNIGREDFKRMYSEFFPQGDSTEFSEYVFRMFDTNSDGLVSCKEFVMAMYMTSSATLEEKVRWAFSMYDTDRDGSITLDEMDVLIGAITEAVGGLSALPGTYETREEFVRTLFERIDANNDGKISEEEWVAACTADEDICACLVHII